MKAVFALSSSPLVMALVMLLIISNSVGSTNLYPSPPPNNSPVSNVTSLLPAPKDHHNSPPPAYSDLHNHPNTFTVVGNIYSHLSYDRMKSSNYNLKGATVKVTCMAGDKEIVGYGKAKINGKYNITIEEYNYAKYGGKGCKAKLIYFAPIEKGSPLNKTTDVQNSKNGTKLEVKSGAYNDVLFQSKSFRNKNENLSINPQAPGNPSAIAYYKLVLQWPTGVCSGVGKKCKKSPWPGYFTIHGLWEVIKSTSTAQHSSDQFDSTKLIGLKKDLKNSWPTLELNTDEDFWKHEWERHGVKSELGLVGYFQETLRLYTKVTASFSKGLKAASIYPDGGKLYSLESIETALESTGHKGIVTCVQHKTLNKQQIQEITFNYTPGLQQQDIVGVSSCTEKFVRFPI